MEKSEVKKMERNRLTGWKENAIVKLQVETIQISKKNFFRMHLWLVHKKMK